MSVMLYLLAEMAGSPLTYSPRQIWSCSLEDTSAENEIVEAELGQLLIDDYSGMKVRSLDEVEVKIRSKDIPNLDGVFNRQMTINGYTIKIDKINQFYILNFDTRETKYNSENVSSGRLNIFSSNEYRNLKCSVKSFDFDPSLEEFAK